MITPYLVYQALYFLLAAPVTWVIERAVGRLLGRRDGARTRFFLTALALPAIGFPAFLVLLRLLKNDPSPGYITISLVLYGGCFWLPLLAVVRAIRARRRPDALVLAACVLALAVAIDGLFIEPNRLQLRREHVAVECWPAAAGRPIRIVHLSDIQTVGATSRERRAAELVNAEDADLIVITGDYLAGPLWNEKPAMAAARRFLSEIRARHGIVAVAGHSEPRRLREPLFAGLPITYLVDEAKTFTLPGDRRLRVVGLAVHDPDLSLLDAPRVPGEMLLVASHVPDVTRDLTGRDVDLHLAGHTHGGQIVIPGFGPPVTLSRLPRRYARGFFHFDDHPLNVCAGLGMEGNHAPRIRLFCPPEVCVVEISGAGKPRRRIRKDN